MDIYRSVASKQVEDFFHIFVAFSENGSTLLHKFFKSSLVDPSDSPLRLLFSLSLQLVVGHGDNGQYEIDEVEGTEEDVDHEENDVPRSGRAQRDLVEVLPKVLRHESEGTKVGGAEAVKAGVAVVGIGPLALQTSGADRALARPGRVAAHDVIVAELWMRVPGAFVPHPVVPRLVCFISPFASTLRFGKVSDADLAEHAHVDLQAEQGEDGQDEGGEDYHIAQVLHRVDDGTDDSLEAGDHSHGLERPEHTERSQGRERAQVDGDRHVRHPDHADVQPVPRIAQIRVIVHEKAASQYLTCGLVRVDGSKYHFCRRGVPETTGRHALPTGYEK